MLKITSLILILLASTGLSAQNLVLNGDCELPLVNGEIPHWQEFDGNGWTQRQASPEPQSGSHYFFPGATARGELRQTIDISAYACRIDAGEQNLHFTAYTRSFDQSPIDESQINIAFFNEGNFLIRQFSFGPFSDIAAWRLSDSTLSVPPGARSLIIYLISTRKSGSNNDGYFDNISLIPVENSPCPVPTAAFTASGSDSCALPFVVDFTDLSTGEPLSWKWIFEGADSDSSSEADPSGIVYQTPGTYDVTLITCNNFGCDTLLLENYIRLIAPPEKPVISRMGDTLQATGEGSFQWYEINDPNSVLGTSRTFAIPQGGDFTFYVVLTNELGCSERSDNFIYSDVSIANPSEDSRMQLYPNPVDSELFVSLGEISTTNGLVNIRTLSGQLVYAQAGIQHFFSIDASNLKAGMYLLEYRDSRVVLNRIFIRR